MRSDKPAQDSSGETRETDSDLPNIVKEPESCEKGFERIYTALYRFLESEYFSFYLLRYIFVMPINLCSVSGFPTKILKIIMIFKTTFY